MSDAGYDKQQAGEAGEIARLLSYVLTLLASAGLFVSANAIPISRFEQLGAGAFPKIVFAGIALVALIAIVEALRKIPAGAYGRFARQTLAWAGRRYLVFVTLGALAVYLVLIPVLGFSIASFLFILGLELVLMPRRAATLLVAVIVAAVFSFGLNWLFAEGFTVFLPRGVF
ncbi:tripartite tricarboxylate transporter TctB family protein [Pseudophaeobacter flagellatus]|uniref:tripartite tricarboxylate transporter TctB family protein n=1 Tax=Pseudophaeobacter flagellatus TaxID=2899119 RepID=UPI001E4C5AFD|nr:tripartite tricarboxylate transporter TctB family protein [Pseudophaeobacter flagellatus]MCD9149329.1 tripartite tricarboxylate transporter TctB family protein [Pseudophaeobacter flagellatus]